MRRRGTILVAVLVIVALSVMATVGLLYRAEAEVTAAVAGARYHQAGAAAMSGLRRAMTIVQVARTEREVWYDNPELFKAQLVATDGVNSWYYTIYAYNPIDPKILRNGVTDEASKINLNFASEEVLLTLPNMEPELVDCLLDYRDQDEDTRPMGAEQDYYSRLPRPYLVRNGMLGTVEELLLIKGFNAPLVYGEDYNLNGLLERNEDDAEDSFPPDNSDGLLDRGLLGMATVWSYERNFANDGERRVNLNAPAGLGSAGLSRETREFVELYLSEGNRFRSPADLLEMRYQLQQDHGRTRAGTTIESGVGGEDLAEVLDRLTTEGPVLAGKVNVNTASVEVLAALPGFGQDLAERVVGDRESMDPVAKETPAWLYTENIVSADTFKEIAPLLTTRSYQFRVCCVAYGWPCGQFRVIEAVIDLALGSPRVIYQRDLTRLGMPFAIDVEQEERAR
ncbi:MAG TPA: helix-hairpin-helix domain-containing protein [Phycisphaerae bacterium]|nr:helix-hairpin-helix domain-containing protein [Phycisphaerae bacterium]